MKAIIKQTKWILLQLVLLFCVTYGGAQVKQQRFTQVKKRPAQTKVKNTPRISNQYKEFSVLLAQASVTFTFPKASLHWVTLSAAKAPEARAKKERATIVFFISFSWILWARGS